MTEREYTPESEPTGATCRWCHGTGAVQNTYAYVPGVNPFGNDAQTVARMGACKHCRGTGTYHSALDPTLENWRRDAS
ncbi:hypothetical protein ACWIG3_18705 [Streptomyces celluloflavus]|uniref:hypothetical protein n=1 Tax=Streptomyces TaxID=1883 RepID=UPI001F5F1F33|nr:hypothetical protein [Streptomyces kasugaensis]